MACPPTCGAAAAILVLGRFREAARHGLRSDVRILAQSMVDRCPRQKPSTHALDDRPRRLSAWREEAAKRRSTRRPAVGPGGHRCRANCTTVSRRTSCSATRRSGFCARRAAVKNSSSTVTIRMAAAIVTNPSGGLLSKGHPLGATGLAQCYRTGRGRSAARPAPAQGRRGAKLGIAAQSRPWRRLRWSPSTVPIDVPPRTHSFAAPRGARLPLGRPGGKPEGLDMIDKKYIGMALPKATLEIEKGRLRFFAKAIGETDPVYTDEAAAKRRGLRRRCRRRPRSSSRPSSTTARLVAGARQHGRPESPTGTPRRAGQFTYLAHGLYAGDVDHRRVADSTDIYDKKNGALEFHRQGSRAVTQPARR